MEELNIIGIDLAKRSFQLHGARSDGSVPFRRKVSRERLLYFLGAQQRCVVAMEACASAHHWGREIMRLGHDVRLIPPIYVKPFVKCHSYQDTSLRYSKSKVFCAVPDAGGGAPFSSARATTGKPSALASITHGAPLQA